MASFEQGDIVRVPFPYTDRKTQQRRPALVVSSGPIGDHGALLWVMMITSAENRPWPGDVAVPTHTRTGLPVPSVVRTLKIATIETRHAEPLGKIGAPQLKSVIAELRRIVSNDDR